MYDSVRLSWSLLQQAATPCRHKQLELFSYSQPTQDRSKTASPRKQKQNKNCEFLNHEKLTASAKSTDERLFQARQVAKLVKDKLNKKKRKVGRRNVTLIEMFCDTHVGQHVAYLASGLV